MGEKAWVIKAADEVQQIAGIKQTQKKQWEGRCIYKMPTCATDLNKKAYKPRAVSFGRYHHGDLKLKALEDHKHRALLHFLEKSKKPLQDYYNALTEVVQDLMGAYNSLGPLWLQNQDKFLQLMIRDGCFMLEILRTFTQSNNKDGGYALDDPIFSNHGKLYMMPYVRRDMLMLENQLPLLVLDKLLAVELENQGNQQDEEFINRLVLKFCSPQFSDDDIKRMQLGKCLHVLDVYRKSLLWEEDSTSQAAKAEHQSQTKTPPGDNASLFKNIGSIFGDSRSPGSISIGCGGEGIGSSAGGIGVCSVGGDAGDKIISISNGNAGVGSSGGDTGDEIIRSATELREAGIRIEKSNTVSLKGITFEGGILRLPPIVVDDITEPMFLNLIAFERFHVGAGNEVTAYIFFMDNIIDNAKDISLLHSCRMVQNAMGSDEAAARLFNSLSKDVTLDPASSLNFVHKEVNQYCKKRWPRWRANFCHTYFQNPWAIVSVIAAIFLFALTIVQTIYTVGQYYQ